MSFKPAQRQTEFPQSALKQKIVAVLEAPGRWPWRPPGRWAKVKPGQDLPVIGSLFHCTFLMNINWFSIWLRSSGLSPLHMLPCPPRTVPARWWRRSGLPPKTAPGSVTSLSIDKKSSEGTELYLYSFTLCQLKTSSHRPSKCTKRFENCHLGAGSPRAAHSTDEEHQQEKHAHFFL